MIDVRYGVSRSLAGSEPLRIDAGEEIP